MSAEATRHSGAQYRVVVTREGEAWLAEIFKLSGRWAAGEGGTHTWGANLAKLQSAACELIVLADDLPDEAVKDLDPEWVFRTGDDRVDSAVAGIRQARSEAATAAQRAAEVTEAGLARVLGAGLSVRDAAVLVGVSPARVAQLVPQPAHPKGTRKRKTSA